jgi:hypothetical protein
MNISTSHDIKSAIINLLSRGAKESIFLVDEIKKMRKGTTKQAVYHSLRDLLKEEVITKHKKEVALNQLWIKKLHDFAKETDRSYALKFENKISLEQFELLNEKDKISYTFRNFDYYDVFWAHTFSLITKRIDSRSPLYLYNPHEFFILVREKREKYLINWMKKNNRSVYLTLGSDTPLDKQFSKNYSSDIFQVAIDPKFNFPNNYYLGVIGDYVFETFFDKELCDKIEKIYLKCASESKAREELEKIVSKKYKMKLSIQNNPTKAAKLKKKLSKNFFIPKDLRGL